MVLAPRPTVGNTRRTLLWAMVAMSTLSACASRPERTPDADATFWSGRLALQVDSDPPQAFHAAFELSGHPSEGALRLTTPLGTAIAQVNWNANGATLTQGSQVSQHRNVDELASSLTGTAMPVTALFDWLQARPSAVPGWQADLSRQGEGRIVAQRTSPSPAATLRIVLDR